MQVTQVKHKKDLTKAVDLVFLEVWIKHKRKGFFIHLNWLGYKAVHHHPLGSLSWSPVRVGQSREENMPAAVPEDGLRFQGSTAP